MNVNRFQQTRGPLALLGLASDPEARTALRGEADSESPQFSWDGPKPELRLVGINSEVWKVTWNPHKGLDHSKGDCSTLYAGMCGCHVKL